MSDLSNKTALVTGSSSGIGRSIALELAGEGAAVTVNYSSNRDGAESVKDSIEANGGSAIAVQADVSDPEQVRSLWDETEEELGSVDVLINNAGIFQATSLAQTDVEEFQAMLDVNLKGPFLMLKEALDRMNDGGSIVNVSTVLTQDRHRMPPVAYTATKAGLEQLTQTMAEQLGSHGITVNTISPGVTDTRMPPDGMDEQIVGMTPLGRIGQPEDIARAVRFLVSDDGAWVTGENLVASGGL